MRKKRKKKKEKKAYLMREGTFSNGSFSTLHQAGNRSCKPKEERRGEGRKVCRGLAKKKKDNCQTTTTTTTTIIKINNYFLEIPEGEEALLKIATQAAILSFVSAQTGIVSPHDPTPPPSSPITGAEEWGVARRGWPVEEEGVEI